MTHRDRTFITKFVTLNRRIEEDDLPDLFLEEIRSVSSGLWQFTVEIVQGKSTTQPLELIGIRFPEPEDKVMFLLKYGDKYQFDIDDGWVLY